MALAHFTWFVILITIDSPVPIALAHFTSFVILRTIVFTVPMAFFHFTCLDENIKAVAYGFGTLYNFLNAVYVLLQIIISMLRSSYILLK